MEERGDSFGVLAGVWRSEKGTTNDGKGSGRSANSRLESKVKKCGHQRRRLHGSSHPSRVGREVTMSAGGGERTFGCGNY